MFLLTIPLLACPDCNAVCEAGDEPTPKVQNMDWVLSIIWNKDNNHKFYIPEIVKLVWDLCICNSVVLNATLFENTTIRVTYKASKQKGCLIFASHLPLFYVTDAIWVVAKAIHQREKEVVLVVYVPAQAYAQVVFRTII